MLAFGIKSAPFYFNKVLRPVVKFLRNQGIRNTVFVDDFLLMMQKLCATDHIEFALNTLEELGWDINFEKSVLIPSTRCHFIGYIIHSVSREGPWVQVTQTKLHKLKRYINAALEKRVVSA